MEKTVELQHDDVTWTGYYEIEPYRAATLEEPAEGGLILQHMEVTVHGVRGDTPKTFSVDPSSYPGIQVLLTAELEDILQDEHDESIW